MQIHKSALNLQVFLTIILLSLSVNAIDDLQSEVPGTQHLLLDLMTKTKNFCVNGKNAEKLQVKEYLTEFSKGPCSPLAYVPGYTGSRLIVVIEDCKELQRSNPKIFAACGWSHCNSWLPGSPNNEYVGWLAGPDSPMSIFVPTDKSRECFSGLMGFDVNFEQNNKPNFSVPSGIKIVPEGESPKTRFREVSRCAASAANSLDPSAISELEQALINAGYRNGLTLQFMPYDWRISTSDNTLSKKYGAIIQELYELNGKKVVIAAHSMGNLVTLNYLWETSQEQKDRFISKYLMIAAPVLGAVQITLPPIGGSLNDKLTFEMARRTEIRFIAGFNLAPKGTFEASKEEPWMKEIKQRITDEEQNIDVKRKGFLSVLPKISEKCSSDFPGVEQGCKLGLHEIWDYGSVVGKKINPGSYFDILKEFSFAKESLLMEKYVKNKNFENYNKLTNPGVSVAAFFMNHVPTPKYYEFSKNPKEFTSKEENVMPKWTMGEGDGQVLSTSAAMPSLKWMYDFEKKKTGQEKPIHLVHFCGNYNLKKAAIFEEKNEFYSMDCACKFVDISTGKCDHGGILSDPYFVKFVFNSLLEGRRDATNGKYESMSENELKVFWDRCRLFNK